MGHEYSYKRQLCSSPPPIRRHCPPTARERHRGGRRRRARGVVLRHPAATQSPAGRQSGERDHSREEERGLLLQTGAVQFLGRLQLLRRGPVAQAHRQFSRRAHHHSRRGDREPAHRDRRAWGLEKHPAAGPRRTGDAVGVPRVAAAAADRAVCEFRHLLAPSGERRGSAGDRGGSERCPLLGGGQTGHQL